MWPARAHPERSPLPPGQPSEAPVRHSSQTSPHQHNTEESTAWQPPPATPASPARPTVAALRSLAASPRPVRTSSTSSPGRSGPRRSSTANGKVVFDAPEVEVPEFWSQVATDVWASKFARACGRSARYVSALTCRPHWKTVPSASAARTELRQLARTREAVRAA
ncbi:hypothetical protein [Streptomyces sp. NPDC056165]|uniref:hypothetical protein n=1 Tax=Streptomyces sp. NPDC056165 TaxID=3345733 RepID=UPI0035DF71F4